MTSVEYFEFHDGQVYAGYVDDLGNQIIARFGNADVTPAAYYLTFSMNTATTNIIHAVTTGFDYTLLASSEHEIAGNYYGAVTFLDTDGSHLWTFTQDFRTQLLPADYYYQWKNIEYKADQQKGCLCGQKDDKLGLTVLYIEFDNTEISHTTTFFVGSTQELRCGGLYIDSTVNTAQMLYHDEVDANSSILTISSLSGTDGTTMTLTNLAADMVPIVKNVSFQAGYWYLVGNGIEVGA